MTRSGRELFSAESRRRAARVMAERGQELRYANGANGHGPSLTLDPAKLARFEPARQRAAPLVRAEHHRVGPG